MRNIFTYDAGECKGSADPLKALRTLWDTLPTLDDVVKNYNAFTKEKKHPKETMPIQGQLIFATRRAFNLPEYERDGNGYLDDEVLEVLRQFLDWLEKKNASTDSKPT